MPDYPPPISRTDFADAEPTFPAPADPPVLVASRRGYGNPRANTTDAPVCAIVALEVRSLATDKKAKKSFARADDHAEIRSASKQKRFPFAPGVEELEIAWRLGGAEFVEALRLELFVTGDANAIWSKTLTWGDGGAPERGSTFFDGGMRNSPRAQVATGDPAVAFSAAPPATDYPDEFLTIAHSPYKLRLSIEDRADTARVTTASRWVYLDVRLEKIQIEWGDIRVLPQQRADVIASFNWTQRNAGGGAHTVNLRNAVHAAETALLQTLSAKEPKKDQDIVLDADPHAFCTDFATQFYDDTAYRRWKGFWGAGPRIPLFARLLVRNSAKRAVDAPLALGGAEFLWDWEERPGPKEDRWFAKKARAETKTYVRSALDYHVQRDTTNGDQPHGATNCHRDHGGKRGPGADPVFPAQTPNGYAPATAAIIDEDFPFPVRRCPGRRWAALSRARTAGVLAGRTGVVFQPSRMAGDTFRVSVHLHLPGFPDADSADDLRRNVKSPSDRTGFFEIWRRIRVRYFRKGNAKCADRKRLAKLYREAGILMEIGEPEPFDAAHYATALTETLDGMQIDPALGNAMVFLEQALLRPQPTGIPYALGVKPYADFRRDLDDLRDNGTLVQLDLPAPVFPGERLTGPNGAATALAKYGGDTLYVAALDAGANIAAGDALTVARTGNPVIAVTGTPNLSADARANFFIQFPASEISYKNKLIMLGFKPIERLCRTYMDLAHPNESGIFFFQFKSRFEGEVLDQPVKAFAPSGSAEPHRALFLAVCDYDGWRGLDGNTDFPGRPAYRSLKAFKPLDSVVAHEMGHNFAICHAPGGNTGGTERAALHEEGVAFAGNPGDEDHRDHCLMNYHPKAVRFCGKCVLRLRGWSGLGPDGGANADGEVVLESDPALNRQVP